MAAFIVFASKVAFICTRNTQCECELKMSMVDSSIHDLFVSCIDQQHCAINTVMCLSALLFDMVCLNVLVCQLVSFPI